MRNSKQNMNTHRGFTLIELLVVIAIIGLLASVVLLSLNSARAKSRDAKRMADVKLIANAMELYFNDSGSYPVQTGDLVPNYLGTWPIYPGLSADGACGTGLQYQFSGTPTATMYEMVFCLGAQTGGYGAGQHTVSQYGIQ
jgi:prepilin-type N-terminal cleavage/methylation domain-containing protein